MTEDTSETGQGHEEQTREVPVCLNCLTPVDPLQHYCPKCGQTVGQLSPYIPFVNIPYNMQPFGRMWRRTWYSTKRSFGTKLLYFLMLVMFAPVIFIGLPFVLWRFMKHPPRRRHGPHEPIADDDGGAAWPDEPPWYNCQDGS
ncbi:MAG TPA: hypothetical protein VNA25_22590 [Phycisphaerae bacterium]|nr:hypothetical protein [Phycisphaerae bacterium]